MSKQSGYARNIIFSLFFSIIVLLLIGFFSVRYLVPIYDIGSQDIYKFMIYLFPILIGLVFVEIGSLIASKNSNTSVDSVDLLPRNSYDSPMYSTINDDPKYDSQVIDENTEIVEEENAEQLSQGDVETPVFENLDEATVEKLKGLSQAQIAESLEWLENGCPLPQDEDSVSLPNLDDETRTLISSLSQDEIKEAVNLLENKDDIDKVELPFDEEINQAILSLTPDEAQSAIDWINAGCNESEVLPFDQETTEKIAKLNQNDIQLALDWLERGAPQGTALPFGDDLNSAIKKFSPEEAAAAVDFVLNTSKRSATDTSEDISFEGTFENVLSNEIDTAKELGYDLSVAIFKDGSSVDESLKNNIINDVKSASYSFDLPNGDFALIFPLFNKEEAQHVLDEKLPKNVNYGLSSLGNRCSVDKTSLIEEALMN